MLYLNMIHDRAVASYAGPSLTAENYHIWEAHWIATAESLAEEFAKAGLPLSAEHMKTVIEEQKRICSLMGS